MSQADWQRVSAPWDKMLSIDAGLSGTGMALFERVNGQKLEPVRVDVFTPKKTLGYMQKAQDIADYIVFNFIEPAWASRISFHGVIEFPDYQEGAARSMGWKKGDLQKLTYLVGVLTAAIPWTRITHVYPRDWKGQLPKDVVEQRLRRDLGDATCRQLNVKTHGWDALGIGLHVLGRFGPEVQNPLPEVLPSETKSSTGCRVRVRRRSTKPSTT